MISGGALLTRTTVLATSLLRRAAIQEVARDKLLSFTDNRQDASLQAEHFNDFAQVALLRSALHKATKDKGAKGLSHGELSRCVFDAMQPRFDEYPADPEVRAAVSTAGGYVARKDHGAGVHEALLHFTTGQ